MSTLSNAHRFRKTVAGWCMIGAPALFLAGSIVSPKLDTNEGALLTSAANHLDRWYLSAVLGFAGFVLFLPAVLGLMHMLRERGAVYGHVGGALALLGMAAAFANAGLAFVVWQMARGGDRAQMTALLHRIDHTAGSALPLLFLSLALVVGLIVLAWGLTRVHAAPVWCADGERRPVHHRLGVPDGRARADRPDGAAGDRRRVGAHPAVPRVPPRPPHGLSGGAYASAATPSARPGSATEPSAATYGAQRASTASRRR